MAYDDTSAYPSQPSPPEIQPAHRALFRLYLLAHLAAAALLILFSVVLAIGTVATMLKGEPMDALSTGLMVGWSVAGLACARVTASSTWMLLSATRTPPAEKA